MITSAARDQIQMGLKSLKARSTESDVVLSMLLEAEARAVMSHADALQIPCLLLKGSALAYWAYPSPEARPCGDVDLLLPSQKQAQEFALRLAHLGYEYIAPAGEATSYELMCRRRVFTDLFLELDVHWALSNSPLFATVFNFEELWAQSIPIPRLGQNARGLCPIHACIHACIHRAMNLSIGIEDRRKWFEDVEILVDGFGSDDWERLTKLAIDKHVAGVVLITLVASAEMFSRALPSRVVVQLKSAHEHESLDVARLSDWKYMQQQTYAALPSSRARFLWCWQRLFPSKAYMSYLYGGGHGYMGLMLERLKRAWVRVGVGP